MTRKQKKIKKMDLMGQLRERRFFKKPSEKRREAKRRRAVTIKKLANDKLTN